MAWTTPRTWTDGELVTAAIMNTHVRDNLNSFGDHIVAIKTTDESVTSNTTPQADDHLLVALGASQVWAFRLTLWIVDTANAKINLSCTMPASGTAFGQGYHFNAAGTFTSLAFSEASATIAVVSPNNGAVQEYLGIATTGGTAGNFQFTWAQGVSGGTAVTVKKGSILSARQIT